MKLTNTRQRIGLKQALPVLLFMGVALLSAIKADATDRTTLVSIYNQSGGANWTNKTNWLSSTALYQWYGVNGGPEDVYVLNLSSNNLSAFPTNVANLANLTELRLNGNGFTGSLPTGLTSLNNLAGLYLQNNQFTGSIPSAYNNLKCAALDLSNNQLGGAIPALNTFMARTSGVNISNNNFVFADLANLQPYISKVTYSPQSQIGVETSLSLPFGSELYIPGYTPYTGDVFQWYCNGVAISGNKVGYISGTYYCKVSNPAFPALTLTSRNITVTVTKPANIFNISDIEFDALWALYVSTNGDNWTNHSGWFVNADVETWYGVDLSSSGKVCRLQLPSNNLSGIIPSALGNLSDLEVLWFYQNSITGTIPPNLGSLSMLTLLNLAHNSLSGSIPPELGGLSNLFRLDLDHNSLSGSIPTELGNLSKLTTLYLHDNSLEGNIPTELGSLSNLVWLYLNDNSLEGNIPTELGSLSNLVWLYLSENKLDGFIPAELGNLSNLSGLALYNNKLEGTIPPQLGGLSKLSYLSISSNKLSGSIPSELGNLSNLEHLFLDNNKLEGFIPPQLGNLSILQDLNLSNNLLSGSIPPELGNLSNLQYLNLDNNSLEKTIPPQLGNLKNLRSLNLSGNLLEGSIPDKLENLSNLEALWLRYNFLTGIVPGWVCKIKYVFIKGGGNYFSSVPSCWSTLKSATVEEPIDPTEIVESCLSEALDSNIDGEALSDYIHNCMAEKMGAKQVLAGVEEMETSTLKAYPNPAKTVLNIEAPFESYDVRLFDFSGRKVLEQQCCDNERLNVSMLKKGIYMLVVESEGKQHTQKITIE